MQAIASDHVSTLTEFLRAVAERHSQWEREEASWLDPWFRGDKNAALELLPGLYRPQWICSQELYDLEEDDFRSDFKLKSVPYDKGMLAQTDWDQYCLMQHYGLPTRLLDWSDSALIALHFALDSDTFENAAAEAAVWMFDPWHFNQVAGHGDDLFFVWEDLPRSYLSDQLYSSRPLPQMPLAVLAPHNSPRITAQRGLFTIHGADKTPLNRICAPADVRFYRLLIPKAAMPRIRRQLRTAGVTAASIYPELAGLCTELKRDWLDLPDIDTSQAQVVAAVGARKSRKVLGRKTDATH